MNALEIARFEEEAQARSAASLAPEFIRVGGGVATYAEPESWLNQAWNLGLHGPVSTDEIDRLVSFYLERETKPKLTVCTLADPSLAAGLAQRGFVLTGFINVFARNLTVDSRLGAMTLRPSGLVIEVVDPSDDAQAERWVQTSSLGFHDDRRPPGAFLRAFRQVIRRPGNLGIMAFIDGHPAGAGVVAVSQPTSELKGASLFGTSVLPAYRERGIHQWLIAERLRLAQERGAMIATIASTPGLATERNAARFGFALAYVKAVLSKPV